MFKRREKLALSKRFNQLLWPHMGFRRNLRYFRLRIVRLSAAPEPLARAIACGVTVCFVPILGVHALLGAAFAFATRANVVAAALTTLVVPPVLLPLIFSLDFLVGRKILRYFGVFGQGTEAGFVAHAGSGLQYIKENFQDLFLPAFVGAALFMVLVWPAVYMAAHKVIEVIARRHLLEKMLRLQNKDHT